jgi:hypothetical protein
MKAQIKLNGFATKKFYDIPRLDKPPEGRVDEYILDLKERVTLDSSLEHYLRCAFDEGWSNCCVQMNKEARALVELESKA